MTGYCHAEGDCGKRDMSESDDLRSTRLSMVYISFLFKSNIIVFEKGRFEVMIIEYVKITVSKT